MLASPTGATILLVYHRDGLEFVELNPGESVVIGRGPPSDLQPRSRRLSRRHAKFERRPDGVWVTDLASTNGTFINGEPVRTPLRLGAQDEVTLGSVACSAHVPAGPSTLMVVSHDRFHARAERDLVQRTVVACHTLLVLVRGVWLPNRWVGPLRDVLPADALAGLYADRILEIAIPVHGPEACPPLLEAILAAAPEGARVSIGAALAPDHGAGIEALYRSATLALRQTTASERVCLFETSNSAAFPPAPIVSDSVMAVLYDEAERVAQTRVPVVLHGEPGSGLATLAQHMHAHSGRIGRFANISAALLGTKVHESVLHDALQEADGGTLFIEEVADLGATAQSTLLRLIDTGTWSAPGTAVDQTVDVRVISRTCKDLEALCADQQFRWELLYRLTAWVGEVPPLRNRREDVRPLTMRFVREAAAASGRTIDGLTTEALTLLEQWTWPGNLVELRNVVDRAVAAARSTAVSADELPVRIRVPAEGSGRARIARTEADAESVADELEHTSLRRRVSAFEANLIRQALEAHGGDADRAAALLHLSPDELRQVQGIDGSDTPQAAVGREEGFDDFRQRVERFEKRIIAAELRRCHGDVGDAATSLGVQRRTLAQKIARFGLGRIVAVKR